MGACQNKGGNVNPELPSVRRCEDQNILGVFQHYVFDKTIVPHKTQPKPLQVNTGTIADHILPPTTTRVVQEYDEAQKKLTNDQFNDSIFKAHQSSISKTAQLKAAKDSVWKRPKDFLSGNICVFDQKIEPNDIKQGALGDCYFLSSLSALSELPELVKKLFITQTYQENGQKFQLIAGLHGIYLCHDGEFIQVALDDHFPCSQQGGPLFSRCNGGELWVLMLEKAYAKIYGTYEKIEAGIAGHALRDLTGAPYEYFIRDQETQIQVDQCWDFIYKYFKKNYLLAASSEQSSQGLESEGQLGIISSHCYAMLRVELVKGSDGKPDRIIQLRNPWGRKEWTGDWSDQSNKWTPKLRQDLNIVQSDDGVFWINVNDFIKEFSQVCVSKIHPNYQYNSIRLLNSPLTDKVTRKIVIMRVFRKTHAFISLHQKDKRVYAKEPNNQYNYSLGRMIIGKIDPKTNIISSYQGDTMDNDRELVIESDYDVGDYAIYVEMDWCQNMSRDIVLSCYGEFAVTFSETETSEVTTNQILECLLRVHQEFTHQDKVHEYGPSMKRTSGSVAGYVYYLYTNESESTTIKEQIQMKKRQNIEICQPFTDSNCFEVEVPAKQSQLVKFRVTSKEGGAYSYSTGVQSMLIEQFTNEQLQQLALRNPDKIVQRKFQNQGLEVYVHVYSYAAGVALLYCNKTQQIYKEQLQLTLTNLRGDNCDPTKVIQLQIPANSGYLLSLKTIDFNKPTSYSMQMAYSLA